MTTNAETTLVQVSLDMLCVADFSGHFRFINPAFTRVLGWSHADMMRHSFFDFIVEEDREPTAQVLAALAGCLGGRGGNQSSNRRLEIYVDLRI